MITTILSSVCLSVWPYVYFSVPVYHLPNVPVHKYCSLGLYFQWDYTYGYMMSDALEQHFPNPVGLYPTVALRPSCNPISQSSLLMREAMMLSFPCHHLSHVPSATVSSPVAVDSHCQCLAVGRGGEGEKIPTAWMEGEEEE